MPYDLHPGEKLAHALKRVSRGELRKGRKALVARKASSRATALATAARDAHALRVRVPGCGGECRRS